MKKLDHTDIGEMAIKAREVYDSCNTLEQVVVAERYANLVLNKFIKKQLHKDIVSLYRYKFNKLRDYKRKIVNTIC